MITGLTTTWPEPHLSDILSSEDWIIRISTHADIVLLMPNAHLKKVTRGPTTSGMGLRALREYGFNTSETIPINVSTIIHDPTKLNIARADIWDFMRAFKSMFDTSKTNLCWNIYLNGHGGLVQRDTTTKTIDEKTAAIAGLNFDAFKDLITFLNGKTDGIQASFLFYSTCFGGGINQTLVNKVLKNIDAKFIVAAYGLNDYFTFSFSGCSLATPLVQDSTTGTWGVKTSESFTNFFSLLADFFGTGAASQSTIKKGKTKDPLKNILQQLSGTTLNIKNQPSIRIPSAGVFSALSVDSKVKILTSSIVKAAEQTNTEIDLTQHSSKPEFLVVYPERIGVPLKMAAEQGIIVPANAQQNNLKPFYIRTFEQIDCNLSLNQFLCNVCLYNQMDTPIIFLVKKLQCKHASKDNQLLENVIVQITPQYKADVIWIDSFEVLIFFAYENKVYETFFDLNKVFDLSDKKKDLTKRNIDHERAINNARFDHEINTPRGVFRHANNWLHLKPANDSVKTTTHETLQAIFDTLDNTVEKVTVGGLAESNSENRLDKLLARLETISALDSIEKKERILTMLDGILDQTRRLYANRTITLASKDAFETRISALRLAVSAILPTEETIAMQKFAPLLGAFNTQHIKQKNINTIDLNDINAMLQLLNFPPVRDYNANIPDEKELNSRFDAIMAENKLTPLSLDTRKMLTPSEKQFISALTTSKKLLLQQQNLRTLIIRINNTAFVYSIPHISEEKRAACRETMVKAIKSAIAQGCTEAVNAQLRYLENSRYQSFARGYAEYKRLYAELTADLPNAIDLRNATRNKENGANKIKEIVIKNPSLVNQIDEYGFTPLYRAAYQFKNLEMTTILLEAGANPHMIVPKRKKSVLACIKNEPQSPVHLQLIELLEGYSA